MAVRFLVIGGGPAGDTAGSHTAASYAARLGAEVTIVESDVLGGAAHLRDCIPSKAMIATGGAMADARRVTGMGLEPDADAVLISTGSRPRIPEWCAPDG